jgi:hypothetical protein
LIHQAPALYVPLPSLAKAQKLRIDGQKENPWHIHLLPCPPDCTGSRWRILLFCAVLDSSQKSSKERHRGAETLGERYVLFAAATVVL